MTTRAFGFALLGAITGIAAVPAVEVSLIKPAFAAEETAVSSLAAKTHFHGIAVDAKDSSRLYLATHHGFFVVGRDGKARRVSEQRDDFMGFTAHPKDPLVLYASGHPESGGNLGFLVSNDRGVSWKKLADGVGGPVDFHQMDVSKADASIIYGVYDSLQRSDDGGRTWKRIGPPPEAIIGLAASSRNADTLYAATQKGLLQSTDAGRTWKNAHIMRNPATMAHVTRAGDLYAYIVGIGLVRSKNEDLQWQNVSTAFDKDFVLHLAVDPSDDRRLYAVTFSPQAKAQALLASSDGGASWKKLGTD